MTREIEIEGMKCFIEGDTEEELALDEANAREFHRRCRGDQEKMKREFKGFKAMCELEKTIRKSIGRLGAEEPKDVKGE